MVASRWDDCQAWSQEDTDEFTASLIVGPIIGIVVGLIMTILTSLPLCCGVMKNQGRIIAMIGIPLGILAILIPLFFSFGACATFIENICDNCENDNGESACDIEDDYNNKTTRQVLEEGCGALGIIVVYLAAYGWAAVILGIVAASLSCCILCGCCKMKEEATYQDNNVTTNA